AGLTPATGARTTRLCRPLVTPFVGARPSLMSKLTLRGRVARPACRGHSDVRVCGGGFFPSPLVGEGGAQRRMRGSLNKACTRRQTASCGDIPLIRLAAAFAASIHLLPQGEKGRGARPQSSYASASVSAVAPCAGA